MKWEDYTAHNESSFILIDVTTSQYGEELKEKRQDELDEVPPSHQSYCKAVQAAIVVCRQDTHNWDFPPANTSPVTLEPLNAPPGSPCPGVHLDQRPMDPRHGSSS